MQFFEDIQVGDGASFGSYAVTREEVLDFARKYDPQPFHLSDAAAAETHFGRLAASGWHTCAMAMAMLVEQMQADPWAALGGAGVDALRWLKPVHPGDTLRCETEIVETRPSRTKPMGIVHQRMTVLNQHDVPVLNFIAIVMVATRG
jgi:acyl dehydratase